MNFIFQGTIKFRMYEISQWYINELLLYVFYVLLGFQKLLFEMSSKVAIFLIIFVFTGVRTEEMVEEQEEGGFSEDGEHTNFQCRIFQMGNI